MSHLYAPATTRRSVRRSRLSQPKSFQQHLQRLERVTSWVDQGPPRFPAIKVTDLASVSHNAGHFLQRTNENVNLLLSLSRIMLSGSAVGLSDERLPKTGSSLPHMMRQVEELQRRNNYLGRRLRCIYSKRLRRRRESDGTLMATSRTGRGSQLGQGISRRSFLPDSRSDVFSKYSGYDLELPADRGELLRLLRPRIVLYFGLMDGRALGRVVVQLYTEAAPLVVLQFIRSCRRQRAHEFAVRRVFSNLWLEGYLLSCDGPGQENSGADPPPDLREPMEFDMRVLSHERHSCVLSCAKEYCVRGFPGGAINFTISFKPLTVANGQRVAFGRVVRGAQVVECMQLYGTKNGKMVRPLVITHCEVL